MLLEYRAFKYAPRAAICGAQLSLLYWYLIKSDSIKIVWLLPTGGSTQLLG